MTTSPLHGDFNGLFGRILCLSHTDSCLDKSGNVILLHTGMCVTVYEEDKDEYGERDDLIASGIVEPSPRWLQCKGSRWILKIDENGVRHESDIQTNTL